MPVVTVHNLPEETHRAQLLVGIEILPDGQRKEGLGAALAELVEKLFGSRVLASINKPRWCMHL